jgi:hypothetical protein
VSETSGIGVDRIQTIPVGIQKCCNSAVNTVVEARRQEKNLKDKFLLYLRLFDDLPQGGWLLDGRQLKAFGRLYKAMASPSYIDYYQKSMPELCQEIDKALRDSLKLNPLPEESPAPDIPFFGKSANALLKLLELPGVLFETLLRAA